MDPDQSTSMQCNIPSLGEGETYEEMKAGFESELYWVRFFMRPCCPPPSEDLASSMVEHLKADVDSRSDLAEDQKDSLKEIFDQRLEWYMKLPVRNKG